MHCFTTAPFRKLVFQKGTEPSCTSSTLLVKGKGVWDPGAPSSQHLPFLRYLPRSSSNSVDFLIFLSDRNGKKVTRMCSFSEEFLLRFKRTWITNTDWTLVNTPLRDGFFQRYSLLISVPHVDAHIQTYSQVCVLCVGVPVRLHHRFTFGLQLYCMTDAWAYTLCMGVFSMSYSYYVSVCVTLCVFMCVHSSLRVLRCLQLPIVNALLSSSQSKVRCEISRRTCHRSNSTVAV